MNKLIFLFFSLYLILNIFSFDIGNISSSYVNSKICNSNSLFPNDINCFFEINIWYYVPDDINKIYFAIYPDDTPSGVDFYYGNLNINDLSKINKIEKNIQNIYELSKGIDKLYVIFSEDYIENKKLQIIYYYNDNRTIDKNPRLLQLYYYKNYPIELIGEPDSEAMVSFYDYEKDPNKIYLISNNKYYIYYINKNSSSINYNTYELNFFDIFNPHKKYEYKIYKNRDYYYIISKMIFIKIEKNEDSLILTDINSENKILFDKIKTDQNIYNLEQIEYSNGEIMHLYFIYDRENGQICSFEYDCSSPNIGITTYVAFYYDGGCFIVIKKNKLYYCSFIKNNNNNMEINIYNQINNELYNNLPSGETVDQIKVFPLDENNYNFLLCSLHSSSNKNTLFCLIFNINSLESDLNNKNAIKIFNDVEDIISINIFPYRSNKFLNDNLFVIVYKTQYNIIDIDNNISITGNQFFTFKEFINRDTSFYDLGNNKYFLTYLTGNNINIGISMGTIPKSKRILTIIEYYQEYLEIDFKELFNENEKLSNENYKIIFIKPVLESKEENNNINANDIQFFYNDNLANLKFYDSPEPEYEIKSYENESQKIIIKLQNSSFNILFNYTIIGEQFASKNHIKIMNLPKCNKFCSTCNYEKAYLSNSTNHYCEMCHKNYEYFIEIENDGKFYNNCYLNCSSENLYYINGEKQCYKQCPGNFPYYIPKLYQCFEEPPEGYFQYENSFELNDKCPEGYLMDGKNKKCTLICPEGYYGDTNTSKCEVNCPENYYKNDINHLCVENCPENYYKNNINHLCVKNCPDGLLSDNQNNLCVNNCPENLFENTINKSCSENCPEKYYKNKLSHKCVEECPEGYYKDNTNYFCLKNCKEGYQRNILTDICISENPENNKVYLDINDSNECTKLILDNYLELIAPNKLYECENLKIEIFSGEDDSKEISEKHNMIYLDINDCLNYIIDNNNNLTSKNQLIIIIIENQSNYSFINNFNFYVYDLNNNKIDLQICKNNNIETKISKDIVLEESEINLIKYYKEKYSIDISDPNQNWLNDICTSFKSKEGLDMSMEYRHSKIFMNICGENLKYDIIYEQSKIKCFLPDYNNNINLIQNNNNFIKYIGESNINLIKCYNLAFDSSKAIKNIANWIILVLFIIKFLFLIVYFFTLMTPIETFLSYWKIFEDIKENNIINNNNNNLLQTIQTDDNNVLTTKKKFIFKNNKTREIKNNNKIVESLSTIVQSKNVKRRRILYEKNESSVAPPKRKKNNNINPENEKDKEKSKILKKKREEKEFVFEKTDKIIYTRYIDKDDDVISEGCLPVILIDAKKAMKKKEEEERKKREEEERKKKEEQEEERKKLEKEEIKKRKD